MVSERNSFPRIPGFSGQSRGFSRSGLHRTQWSFTFPLKMTAQSKVAGFQCVSSSIQASYPSNSGVSTLNHHVSMASRTASLRVVRCGREPGISPFLRIILSFSSWGSPAVLTHDVLKFRERVLQNFSTFLRSVSRRSCHKETCLSPGFLDLGNPGKSRELLHFARVGYGVSEASRFEYQRGTGRASGFRTRH